VNSCDHSFCRTCITNAVNEGSKCPQCGSFAWLKDLQMNRELLSAVEFFIGLRKVVHNQNQSVNVLQENEISHSSKPDLEEAEDCQSWPLSGVVKKKSLNTYEKKHRQNEKAKQKKQDVSSKNDQRAENAFYEENFQYIEENLFRDDDQIASGAVTAETSQSTGSSDNGKKTNAQKRMKETEKCKSSPKLPKRRSLTEKDPSRQSSRVVSQRKRMDKNKQHPSVTKVNIRGETPLHVAAIKKKYDRVEELLGYGADPNAKDFAGWTPLHEACNHGSLDIVQLLLENGAFIDIPGCDHDTPLHDAIANNRLDVAEFLISRGASLDIRNKQGLLPMDYVKSSTAREQLLLAASMAKENATANEVNFQPKYLKIDRTIPKCIIHTGLDLKQKKVVEKCAKMLDAKVVEQFSDEVTHVVTAVDNDDLCSRTMKFLLGVITGKWIISYDWILKSLEKHEWLCEEEFEVKGCPGASTGTPSKARINAVKQFPPLFDGCSFYFSGEFHSTPSKAEYLDLIKLGGGIILHREPKAETSHPLITPSSPALMKMISSKMLDSPTVAYHAKPDTAQSHCTQFIIFDSEASPHHKQLSTPIMCTAPSTWILDCISNFELVEVKEK